MRFLALSALLSLSACTGLQPIPGKPGDDSGGGGDTLTVADVEIAPGSVDFGAVLLGSSQTATVTLTNRGSETRTISSAFLDGDAVFTLTAAAPVELASGDEATMTVTFEAAAEADYSGELRILVQGEADFAVVPLTGTGSLTGEDSGDTPSTGDGALSLSDDSIDFGTVTVGDTATKTVTVTNTGDGPALVTDVISTSAGVVDADMGEPVEIAAGASRTLTVTYTPITAVTTNAMISIESEGGQTLDIEVTGEGFLDCVICKPVISVITGGSTSTTMDQFKATYFANPDTHDLVIQNSGDEPLEITGITLTNDTFPPAKIICGTDGVYNLSGDTSVTLDAYDTHTISVSFKYNGSGLACGEVYFGGTENTIVIKSNASNGTEQVITLGGTFSPF